ncbi:MAG: hypothetical protein DBX63_02670 [Clostridia bacterium]|nr:MAG: hypothetical protein DBX63_02670 [Clostridia bacterium]
MAFSTACIMAVFGYTIKLSCILNAPDYAIGRIFVFTSFHTTFFGKSRRPCVAIKSQLGTKTTFDIYKCHWI